MKLTKAKLISLTKNGLKNEGYLHFKDTVTGAQGLYVKYINELYLTLGLTISRYYDSMFTASYYLSKVTVWGAVWGDIPKNSYQRVGLSLTKDERQLLLDHEYAKDGVRDAWWNINDQNAIENFLETIRITESRFLSQSDLAKQVQDSKDVNLLDQLVKMTSTIIKSFKLNEYSYEYLPSKPIDDIPIEWFKAAERAIIDEKAILNANTVKRLAADAYRQKILQG